jgi:hypothetical protein
MQLHPGGTFMLPCSCHETLLGLGTSRLAQPSLDAQDQGKTLLVSLTAGGCGRRCTVLATLTQTFCCHIAVLKQRSVMTTSGRACSHAKACWQHGRCIRVHDLLATQAMQHLRTCNHTHQAGPSTNPCPCTAKSGATRCARFASAPLPLAQRLQLLRAVSRCVQPRQSGVLLQHEGGPAMHERAQAPCTTSVRTWRARHHHAETRGGTVSTTALPSPRWLRQASTGKTATLCQ